MMDKPLYKNKYMPVALLGLVGVLIYLYKSGKQDVLDDLYLQAISRK